MTQFRMLQYGEEIWRGKAIDWKDAEERCFDSWDETPGSLERYTLQRWGVISYGPSMKGKGWVMVYKDQCLAA